MPIWAKIARWVQDWSIYLTCLTFHHRISSKTVQAKGHENVKLHVSTRFHPVWVFRWQRMDIFVIYRNGFIVDGASFVVAKRPGRQIVKRLLLATLVYGPHDFHMHTAAKMRTGTNWYPKGAKSYFVWAVCLCRLQYLITLSAKTYLKQLQPVLWYPPWDRVRSHFNPFVCDPKGTQIDLRFHISVWP